MTVLTSGKITQTSNNISQHVYTSISHHVYITYCENISLADSAESHLKKWLKTDYYDVKNESVINFLVYKLFLLAECMFMVCL